MSRAGGLIPTPPRDFCRDMRVKNSKHLLQRLIDVRKRTEPSLGRTHSLVCPDVMTVLAYRIRTLPSTVIASLPLGQVTIPASVLPSATAFTGHYALVATSTDCAPVGRYRFHGRYNTRGTRSLFQACRSRRLLGHLHRCVVASGWRLEGLNQGCPCSAV
ncbi:hypothetical protein EXIGLDRAFT_465035 [Exidia glandulosa HHB12029]|uniref:Uncharacterized protein n=1 Tax=Exidia glandulosa HHB12029 TaxID=1314781 RepID=A0A165K209_EXIGL|nr:hypothetical protein EXIGLDRAFT_465035 [Exidia glandulosa HHB12029]